ncbi:MAG: amidophosphoribosyltransferase [bacterium]
MCGVIGLFGKHNVISDIYLGLMTIQHRGQDSAGAITYSGRYNLKKGNGLVRQVFNEKNLARLRGNMGIGHVRYPTLGGGGAEDAQPFYVNVPYGIAMVHNGNVTNYLNLRRQLFERDKRQINSTNDVEVILNVFAEELSRRSAGSLSEEVVFAATESTLDRVEGSYSTVATIANVGLLAFRDPQGIKPLVYGRRGSSFAFASESVTLDVLGYKKWRDVAPGECIFIDCNRNEYSRRIKKNVHTPCIFEWVYFARPDSVIDGIGVYEARLGLGRELATAVKKAGITPEVVIPVPDTAKPAALALAMELGVPFREGLMKNRYIGRTFIMSGQKERTQSIKMKLNPIRAEIEGKKVLLVDDSIVRGNTSRKIIQLVRDTGARGVYFASSSPPLKHPCAYGIDMQTRGEFIARDKSVEETKQIIGADELVYQTMKGLLTGVAGARSDVKFCAACFSGRYPTKISREAFHFMEADRSRKCLLAVSEDG